MHSKVNYISANSKRRLALYISILVLIFTSLNPVVSSALSPEQKALYRQNINYYDIACSSIQQADSETQAGSGAPTGAAFPNLPPSAMAEGINKYIEKTNGSSKLKGLGSTIVSGAENSNVSPFLIIAIAQKESGLSNPGDFNVKNAGNSFGRTATSSQPNFQGSRLWYKWSSVKASVDHTAPENKNASGGGDIASYLREKYGGKINRGSLSDIMNEYAPPGDGNDTSQYIEDIKKWTNEMIDLTNKSGGEPGQVSPDNDLVTDSSSASAVAAGCACPGGGATGASAGLSSNVPEPWRSLIEDASRKPESASADPNLVAAVLWVENRGWPDYNKEWAVSSAAAAGPWQFIPSTWASMGRDGDGDGRKDPNNPKDAVLAAFIHHKGSKGKPLAKRGYDSSKSADENFNTTVLERNDQNLLAFAAKYNGSGAPDGAKLVDFPRGDENSDYVKMAYWLLASDFKYAYDVIQNKKIDAKSGGSSASGGEAVSSLQCDTVGADGDGTTIGEYAIPVPKKYWESNYEWFTKPHHTYPAADIPVPSGTNLYSVTSGKVTSVGTSGGAGYAVFIDYNGATIGYFHGTPGTGKVKAGDSVRPGQLLMKSGYTGNVRPPGPAGAHLHLDIVVGGSKRCPQEIFKAMKANKSIDLKDLPSSGCVG